MLEAVQQPVGVGGGIVARLELPEPDEPRHAAAGRLFEQMLEVAPKPGQDPLGDARLDPALGSGGRPGARGRGRRGRSGADLAAVLTTCHQPRRRGRGRESEEGRPRARPPRRGDRGCSSSWRGMRQSEVQRAALRRTATGCWSPSAAGMKDVRFVKGSVDRASKPCVPRRTTRPGRPQSAGPCRPGRPQSAGPCRIPRIRAGSGGVERQRALLATVEWVCGWRQSPPIQ